MLILFSSGLYVPQVDIRGRTIKYKAKGRVHKLKWVYDGTAWDVESGISETAKHHKSKQGAIEHGTLKLLERLKRDGILSDGGGGRSEL